MADAKITGYEELKKRLAADGGFLHQYAKQIAAEIKTETVANLSNRMVRIVTGKLVSSIETVVTPTGRKVTIEVGTRVKYARIVHDGRGPVYPKRAPALRVKFHDGKVAYLKRVGPAAPRPYLTDAYKKVAIRHGLKGP